tara:strand:+ start:89 stop:454 length:366 start_codon:yes stop_codon:yes gene_type:complete
VVLRLEARHHLAVKSKEGCKTLFFYAILLEISFFMALHMREQILRALIAHAQGDIAKHKANIEIYLEHPAGVGEHTDILESIEKELDAIAKYQDQIDVIKKYFMSSQTLRDIDRRSGEVSE